jgi:cyclic pyranopterin monophosphate synthase
MKMIDVGGKEKTERVAIARGFVSMASATVGIVRRGESEKGDVLAAARIAGILAAKKTPEIVPLCHPIALSAIDVEATPRPRGVEIVATVRTVDRTGVEMEALAAVCAGCLTVYDMLKRYERGMRIEAVELIEKRGGRSGTWQRPSPAAARPARSPAPRGRSSRTRAG